MATYCNRNLRHRAAGCITRQFLYQCRQFCFSETLRIHSVGIFLYILISLSVIIWISNYYIKQWFGGCGGLSWGSVPFTRSYGWFSCLCLCESIFVSVLMICRVWEGRRYARARVAWTSRRTTHGSVSATTPGCQNLWTGATAISAHSRITGGWWVPVCLFVFIGALYSILNDYYELFYLIWISCDLFIDLCFFLLGLHCESSLHCSVCSNWACFNTVVLL